jgi:hypothetical protein
MIAKCRGPGVFGLRRRVSGCRYWLCTNAPAANGLGMRLTNLGWQAETIHPERDILHEATASQSLIRKVITMRFFPFFARAAVATAMSQNTMGAPTTLPGVLVEAPRHVARPNHSAVVHSHTSRNAAERRTSHAVAAPSGSEPVLAKLAKLEKATGSCVDGCQTSFKSGNRPWNGCSTTAWPMMSPTCRNAGNYKTYAECEDAGLTTGWRNNDVGWYCSSLGLK